MISILLASCSNTRVLHKSVTGLQLCDNFKQSNQEAWNLFPKKTYNAENTWKIFNNKYSNIKKRKIVIFIDGTGNTQLTNTNIWKLYTLSVKSACDQAIIPFYHEGIGTSFGNKLLGGALGAGISRNIKNSYQFLSETYKEEDEIFIFGFSRGAYAARSLNGMIEFVGLININELLLNAGGFEEEKAKETLSEAVEELYRNYSVYNDGKPKFVQRLIRKIANKSLDIPIYRDTKKVKISAIGVFDTVAALGIKRDDFPDNHRTGLYASAGYHALAIDEQRNDFRPLRFEGDIKRSQSLIEMWFPGAHADVGGGYGDQYGLESVSRAWMIKRFEKYNIFPKNSENMRCNKLEATCERGELHDEFLSSKLFGKMGIHWRRPREGDNMHGSALCRVNVAKLLKPNKQGREPGFKYRPENLHKIPEAYYNVGPYQCSGA